MPTEAGGDFTDWEDRLDRLLGKKGQRGIVDLWCERLKISAFRSRGRFLEETGQPGRKIAAAGGSLKPKGWSMSHSCHETVPMPNVSCERMGEVSWGTMILGECDVVFKRIVD
jgi:hypothetical protein